MVVVGLLIGLSLAQSVHTVGSVIAPERAAKDAPQEMFETAAGNVETALAAIAPRGATPAGITRISPKPPPAPSAGEIEAAADKGFEAVRQSGAAVKTKAVENLSNAIERNLRQKGFRDIRAPETFQTLAEMRNPPAGSVATIDDLHVHREALALAAKSTDARERLAASKAIEALDRYLEKIPASDFVSGDPAAIGKQLREAIGNYAALKKAEDIGFRGEKAANLAASANSGANLENHIRSQVRQILNNKKAQRGFTKAELDLMRKINRGDVSANSIRRLGNLLGGGGGIGAGISAMIGNWFLPGIGAGAPFLGAGAKSIGNVMASRRLGQLEEAIRARSPLGQSMIPPSSPISYGLPSQIGIPSLLSGVAPRALLPFLANTMPASTREDEWRAR